MADANSTVPTAPMSAVIIPPPLDEIGLVSVWMCTVLYGFNVMLYGACLYILVQRQKAKPQWILLSTTSVLFLLSTLQIAASLRQLIEAFIILAKTPIPGATILYWLDLTPASSVIKIWCYVFIDIIQDSVMIWRVYVVFSNSWKIALLPALLEATHAALAIFDSVTTTTFSHLLTSPVNRQTNITAWTVVLMVNIYCTAAIAGRLIYLGRMSPDSIWDVRRGQTKKSTNRYRAPIITIIESGAIITTANVVLVAMYGQNDPKLLGAVSVAAQLAVLTPLLLIVRVGFRLRSGTESTWVTTHQANGMQFSDPLRKGHHPSDTFVASHSQASALRVDISHSASVTKDYEMNEYKHGEGRD